MARRKENTNRKIICSVILFTSFLICNWLMDMFNFWAPHIPKCIGNGFFSFCNVRVIDAIGHGIWYISIAIVVIMFIMLLIEVKNGSKL